MGGIKFTDNVVADPDLASACTDATLLVFVLPHQFLGRICPQMTTMAKGCKALSLIKGIEFEEGGPILISNMIKDAMSGMEVSVLMGANVANEVARDDFCESAVGYADKKNGLCWQRLLDCSTFRVGSINDVAGVELCGALKNVVALGAGFCDGLGFGGNTKAAIIRIGLKEGSWDALEKAMLNGQKLQGTITAKDVMVVLRSKGLEKEFPLFTRIHEIAFEGKA